MKKKFFQHFLFHEFGLYFKRLRKTCIFTNFLLILLNFILQIILLLYFENTTRIFHNFTSFLFLVSTPLLGLETLKYPPQIFGFF